MRLMADPSWRDVRVPGRPGLFAPSGVMVHHTASAKTVGPGGSVPMLQRGRPDLPGPLCQLHIDRAGAVWLITDGRANHAGRETGDADRDGRAGEDGNAEWVGIEVDNDGVGEPWPTHVLHALDVVCATLCRANGWHPGRVIGHREWAPDRKIDPNGPGMDMRQVRARVAGLVAPPRPAIIETREYPLATIIQRRCTIPLDGSGDGWCRIDDHIDRVIGAVAHGLRPSADHTYGRATTVEVAADGAGTIVSVLNGEPGGMQVALIGVVA